MSIRSAFEFWPLKSHGTGSSQGLSPSELQTDSTADAYYPVIHIACFFMANGQIQSVTTAHR